MESSSSSTDSPNRERTLTLMAKKDSIEAQIEHHISILRANDSTMQSPLVDTGGFPRADIDVASVRIVSITYPSRLKLH